MKLRSPMGVWIVVWLLLVILAITGLARFAHAHDKYEKWTMKKTGSSCCSEKDCYVTPARRDPKTGYWYGKRREDGKWLRVEKHVYDPEGSDGAGPDYPGIRNAPDDGQAHMCAPGPDRSGWTEDTVYCFEPGSGI